MSDNTIIILILGAIGTLLFVAAPRLSEALVRARASRLPVRIAERLEEEWLGELHAIASRPGKLAFAIALTLTRRQAFAAPGEDSMSEITKESRLSPLTVLSGRKTLVILSTVMFAIAAYGASFLLPTRYVSESLILVRSRQVPSSLVADPIAGSGEDRLKSIEQTVFSRTALLGILNSFPQLKIGRETWSKDRTVEELRKDIAVLFQPSHDGANLLYFRLHYVGDDPEIARQVVSKLTSSFLEASFRMKEAQVYGTRDFLRWQLDVLAKRVAEKGDELARERAAHGPEAGRILALDYELLVSSYRTMFTKFEDSQMAHDLESEQEGQAFLVVDPANRGTPVAPYRLPITGIGALTGVVLGGMAVVSRDRRRRRALA